MHRFYFAIIAAFAVTGNACSLKIIVRQQGFYH